MDTDASQVAKGDWTYALNARTHSSNKTNLNNANLNLTTGDKRSVKPYLGEENVPTVWRNWAGGTVSAPSAGAVVCGKIEGNGIYNKGYFVFRKFTPTSEYACRISFWSEGVDYLIVTLGNLNQSNSVWLNFDFTAVAQIDDYLYFIGPDNIQYKYPIKGLPSTVTNTTTNPYRLIKVKPLGAPEINLELNGTIFQQKIAKEEPRVTDGLQFSYAYKYYDNTITPLSYFSEVLPLLPNEVYIIKHSSLDDSNTSANNLRALGVQSLIFYFRKSDVGLWYQLAETKLNGTTVAVSFNPATTSGIALPNNKQNKYFEAIPITSKALETVNGRIFLGNNKLSFENPTVPSGSSSIQLEAFSQNLEYTNLNINTAVKVKSFKEGGVYNIGVYGVDAFGRPTPITQIGSTQIFRRNPEIFDTNPDYQQIRNTRKFKQGIGAGISNAVTFPIGTTRYGFAVTKCLNMSLFITGVAGWLYAYDKDRIALSAPTVPYFPYVMQRNDASNPVFSPVGPTPATIAVYLSAGEGYQWQAGDRLHVVNGYYAKSPDYSSGTTLRFSQNDYEIAQAFGNVLILEQDAYQTWYVSVGSGENFNYIHYEIYRPEVVAGDQVYYAASPLAPITELTNNPSDNLKALEGDVMLLPFGFSAVSKNKVKYNDFRNAWFTYDPFGVPTTISYPIPGIEVTLFKECTTWSVNFPYDQTWNNRTLGWINQPLTISSQIPLDSQTHICFSDPKIAATEVDGTGNFDALNYAIYPQEYGPISKLIRVSDNQLESVGALLMSLFQRETVSIYISRVTLQEITNVAQVLLSDKILGSFNAQLGSFGCINPESVIRQDNRIYYWDATKNKVVRYSRDGLTAISDFGMKSQFALFRDKPTKVYAGYDYPNEELYLTFKTNPALSAPTYVWNEIENRWVTLHTVNPQFYGPSGEYSVFTYFIGGLPKGFTDVNNPSRFNINQVVTPIIDFAVNPDLLIRKNAMAVWLYKNFTPKQGDVGLLVSMNKGWDYFSNETQLTLAGEQPQDNFDGQELLKYTFDKIPYDQLITEANEASFVQGEDWFTFFYATLRIRLGQNKRGIYLVNLQYQYEDNEATEGL